MLNSLNDLAISFQSTSPTVSILTKALVHSWDSKYFAAILEKATRRNKSKAVPCLIGEKIVYFRKSVSRQ